MNFSMNGMKSWFAAEADRLRHLDAIGWMEEGCLLASIAMLGVTIGLCITQSPYWGNKSGNPGAGSPGIVEEDPDYVAPESGTVTGFGAFDLEEHYITAYIQSKPTEDELKAYMPKTIPVYLNDSTYEVSDLAVDWKCVEENYMNSDLYYYQFSPEWDQEVYPLDTSLNLLADGPYVGVFLKEYDEFDDEYDTLPTGVVKVGGKDIASMNESSEEEDDSIIEDSDPADDSEYGEDSYDNEYYGEDSYNEWDGEAGYYDIESGNIIGGFDDSSDWDSDETVTGVDDESEIYDYLVNELGLNSAAACGVMSNIHAKSLFRAENLQQSCEVNLGYNDQTYTEDVDMGSYFDFANDGAGYGLLGWSDPDQKGELLAFADEQVITIGDWEMQMEFLESQLEGDYKNVWSYLTAVPETEQGAYDAAYYWCYYYEKPDNYASIAISRGNLARNVYWDSYGSNGYSDSSWGNGDYSYGFGEPEVSSEDSGEDYEYEYGNDYSYNYGYDTEDEEDTEDEDDMNVSGTTKAKGTTAYTYSSSYSSPYSPTSRTYQSYNSYTYGTTTNSYYNRTVSATSVTLSESTLSLKKGDTHTLKAKLSPSNSTDNVTWYTGNSSVATVSGGKVTAIGNGSTNITARATSGRTATCKVTVYEDVTAPKVKIDKENPYVGETVKITWDKQDAATGYKVYVTQGDKTVDKETTTNSFSFKPTKGGEYTIKVRAFNDKYHKTSKALTMNVKVLVSSVTLNKETMTLTTGKSEKLTATMGPEGSTGDEISAWTSSDEKIAKVSDAGKVTAVAAGTCTIQVKTKNGLTAKCKVTVVDKPVIVTQPENQYADKGALVMFFVETEGKNLTYQWQSKTAEYNAAWTNCKNTGAKTACLSVDVTNSMNGYSYRCIVSNSAGESATSEAGTLTVGYIEPTILTQPEECMVPEGSPASFSVEVMGVDLTYQWEYKEDVLVEKPEDIKWYAVPGVQGEILNLESVTKDMGGRTYRCVIKDSKGKSVTSDTAMLTIGQGIVITKHPDSHAVDIGDQVSFVTSAEGEQLTYRWEYRSAGGTKWVPCRQTTAATAKLKVKVTAYMDGMRFRCVITDVNGYHRTTNVAVVNKVTDDVEEPTEESSENASSETPQESSSDLGSSEPESSSEQSLESSMAPENAESESASENSGEGLLASLFRRRR